MGRRTIAFAALPHLALVVAPAFAQTSPAPQDAQPGVAGSAAADPQPPSVTPADGATDIVVTGLRRSLQSAQAIKRTSVQQIDSIVASDIGKLPDVALSDTAARIPGVQVERGGGEASRVLIRGFDQNYYTTTYNSREIFTAETRSVALQDFPAGAIAALEVFKTTTADLVEGGIAGEVNVRSRKPFDFKGLEIAGSLWGQYEKRSRDFNPNGNLLISDRWSTGIGELGALVNFSYTSIDYLDSARSNTDFIANPVVQPGDAVLRFPDIQRIDFGEGKRTRPSLNGALQWRPAPGLELYAEALWQGFRNKVSDRQTEVPLYGGSSYTDVVTRPGTNLVDSMTVVDPNRPAGFQAATYGKTDTYQYAVGGKYDSGPAHLSFDVARTASRYSQSTYSFDTSYAAPTTVTVATGLANSAVGPTFGLAAADPKSASNYIFRGFFDRQLVARGRDWQARVDGAYDTGIAFLPKLSVGLRYVDRTSHFEDGSRYANLEASILPLSAVPVSYAVSESGFPSDDPTVIRGYYTPTYESLRGNIEQLRSFVGFTPGAPPADPLATYTGREKSYAGYAQLTYAVSNTAGVHVDGAIGVRGVRTDLNIAGTSVSQATPGGPNVFTPLDVDQGYTDWLPNASARLHLSDTVQLRLSATKTRTRPAFAQYDPAYNIGAPPSCEFDSASGALLPPGQNTSCFRSGSSGNASLKPLKSDNYDASLEWYFSRTGTVAISYFRRDLQDFILTQTLETTDPNGYVLRLAAPVNSGRGRITGSEAIFTTFLDFAGLPDWMHAFGIDTNLTYIKAHTGTQIDDAGTIAQRQIPGVSKWTYNIAGIYEHGPLAARLSWNHRSSYLGTFQIRGADRYTETVRGTGRLDLSASYVIMKDLTLTADWTNMLAKPFRSDLAYAYADGTTAIFPRVIRYEESVWSAGIRFRF